MAKKRNKRNVAQKKLNAGHGVKVNRKYKDTVFRMLFSDRKNLLSLYNAVSGKEYKDPAQLKIVTSENAIYMGIYNDLAFIIDTNLFLYEHQSTYNPNIPLRDLFYIAGEYQKMVEHKSLYSTMLQKIPAPSFLVFYNGTKRMQDRWENRLSDAFENLIGEPNLELRVITLNVNEGHNRELMEQCQILKEYAQYVARVRKYAEEMTLEEAVQMAVNECVQEDILAEFLRKNRAEVIAVSIFEYDKEEEEKKLRKAEFEYGVECGVEQGQKITQIKMIMKKVKKGLSVSEIADILEENVDFVQNIYDVILANPKDDEKEIYYKIKKAEKNVFFPFYDE